MPVVVPVLVLVTHVIAVCVHERKEIEGMDCKRTGGSICKGEKKKKKTHRASRHLADGATWSGLSRSGGEVGKKTGLSDETGKSEEWGAEGCRWQGGRTIGQGSRLKALQRSSRFEVAWDG